MAWSQDLAYLLKKNFIFLFPKILLALILATPFLAIAIMSLYCYYSCTNQNTTSCILTLACLEIKVLHVYKVIA